MGHGSVSFDQELDATFLGLENGGNHVWETLYKTVRLLALLLRRLFQVPYKQLSPFLPLSSWWGCSDASASKDGDSFAQ